MNLYKKVLPYVSMLSLLLGLVACATPSPKKEKLTPVTVQLRWYHQAQFAGFYAADQNGYYSDEGLGVTFIEGTPTTDFITPVLDGIAQFGVTNPDSLIIARSKDLPVKAIACIYQRSPGVYIALASSGISKPQDFIGKTIEVGPSGFPRLNAMMSKLGIRSDEYTTMDSSSDLSALYEGRVDVRVVNLTNEVLLARADNVPINIIYPDDFGIHFYGDVLFTSDAMIQKNPDLVLRFLRATLKGWTWAIENPNLAGNLVHKYNSNADELLENDKMIASIPIIFTGEEGVSWMIADIWSGMEQTLHEQNVLTLPVDITQVYTMQFLEEIYK
jgi:NitT/TauT family transport system substrate-binding protein